MRDALMLCGTKSGKDVNKYKACNLELAGARKVLSPIIMTPAIHFECKILLKTAMDPKCLDEACEVLYPAKDYHTLYFGEIVACYQTE
jgi:flavin reductase (DIM6/NTAB) family NADH-FMN oxidoreductase RutF